MRARGEREVGEREGVNQVSARVSEREHVRRERALVSQSVLARQWWCERCVCTVCVSLHVPTHVTFIASHLLNASHLLPDTYNTNIKEHNYPLRNTCLRLISNTSEKSGVPHVTKTTQNKADIMKKIIRKLLTQNIRRKLT